jgi:hypothetical protein
MNRPNIFLQLNRSRPLRPQDWKNTWYIRQERIKKEGSEPFTWAVPVTAAGATSHIELARQFPRCKKYLPLDFAEVINNDTVDLTVTIKGNVTWIAPAATIHVFSGEAYIWEIAVTNNHALNPSTLNKLYIILRRLPKTVDDYAREQY